VAIENVSDKPVEVAAYRQLAVAVIGRAIRDARDGDRDAREFLAGGPALDFWRTWLSRA
jgi:hypothetical protein